MSLVCFLYNTSFIKYLINNIIIDLPIIGLEPIPLVGLDFKSNVSAIPPDGLQLGRTRTPTLHYERNALPAKLLAFGSGGTRTHNLPD